MCGGESAICRAPAIGPATFVRLAHGAGGALVSGLFSHGGGRSGVNVAAVYGAGRALGYSGAVSLSSASSGYCAFVSEFVRRTQLFVTASIVLQPAIDVPSLWIVVSPVYDAAAIIRLVNAVVLNGIAALQRRNARGHVDVVCYQQGTA